MWEVHHNIRTLETPEGQMITGFTAILEVNGPIPRALSTDHNIGQQRRVPNLWTPVRRHLQPK